MSLVKRVHAREILDSRGCPTLEAEVWLSSGARGRAAVPSGASVGKHEAVVLRDEDKGYYAGLGVLKSVELIQKTIHKLLVEKEWADQAELDTALVELDKTSNKSQLGGNTLLAVSLAFAKAKAYEKDMPLYAYLAELTKSPIGLMPVPLMNILNGGAHAANNLDIQEFMILPVGAASFDEALRFGAETFYALKSILKTRGFATEVGDEGGFAPSLRSNTEALDLIMEAITQAGHRPAKDIYLGIDVASSEFYANNSYYLRAEDKSLSSMELIDYLADLVRQYPIISIEDGLAEEDWKGWEALTERLGKAVQLVGDDLFVTNPQIFQQGIEENIANAILIKPNQIGTLTHTLEAIEMAKKNGYAAIISHRSGETEDTTIAHLAVGTAVGQIKAGSLSRSERLCKYNELLRIQESLNKKAKYAGWSTLATAGKVVWPL